MNAIYVPAPRIGRSSRRRSSGSGWLFNLLSDEHLEAVYALQLPVFEWEGRALIKRTTLAVREGKVEKV